MGQTHTDLEFVRRVQKGDKAAFDILVRKYQHKIANLISRYVNDPTEVQDVTQEAFIKAYRGLSSFRADSAFYTWLYRIAINTAKNYLVSAGRHLAETTVESREAEQFNAALEPKDIATPEGETLTREIKQTVYETIKSLPEELKTAITLRELEGMSYQEIAQAMECPIGTVRSRIFRAREAIDDSLRPLLDETGKSGGNERQA